MQMSDQQPSGQPPFVGGTVAATDTSTAAVQPTNIVATDTVPTGAGTVAAGAAAEIGSAVYLSPATNDVNGGMQISNSEQPVTVSTAASASTNSNSGQQRTVASYFAPSNKREAPKIEIEKAAASALAMPEQQGETEGNSSASENKTTKKARTDSEAEVREEISMSQGSTASIDPFVDYSTVIPPPPSGGGSSSSPQPLPPHVQEQNTPTVAAEGNHQVSGTQESANLQNKSNLDTAKDDMNSTQTPEQQNQQPQQKQSGSSAPSTEALPTTTTTSPTTAPESIEPATSSAATPVTLPAAVAAAKDENQPVDGIATSTHTNAKDVDNDVDMQVATTDHPPPPPPPPPPQVPAPANSATKIAANTNDNKTLRKKKASESQSATQSVAQSSKAAAPDAPPPPPPPPSLPRTAPQQQAEEDARFRTALYVAPSEILRSGQEGDTRFIVVENDSTKESMAFLINLKEIFAKQLPKMPKEYIVRLVLDRSHRSLLAVKNNKVVGGICFRPYFEQQFAEIAFCAVSAHEQVKGYGTRLMNQLKEYVKSTRLTHFLTYADNYAIGYFRKQGFTKHISMPRERWANYIKDYDGGTLMECVVNKHIDYLRVHDMVAKQRIYVMEQIKRMSKAHVVYPGLKLFARGKVVRNALEEIPGVKAAGWHQPSVAFRKGLKKQTPFQLSILGIYKQVFQHKDSWPFHEPVAETVIDYLEVVRNPIDLSLIRRRVEGGMHYKNKKGFLADLRLMCENCRLYNDKETNFYKCADGLQEFFEPMIEKLDDKALLAAIATDLRGEGGNHKDENHVTTGRR